MANSNEIPLHEKRLVFFRCINCMDFWARVVNRKAIVQRVPDADRTQIIENAGITNITCPSCDQEDYIKQITPEKYSSLLKLDQSLFPAESSTPDMFEKGKG